MEREYSVPCFFSIGAVETKLPIAEPRLATVNVFQMAHPEVKSELFIEDAIKKAVRCFSQAGIGLIMEPYYNVNSPAGTVDDPVGRLQLTKPFGDSGLWQFTHTWFDFSRGMDLAYNNATSGKTNPNINAYYLRSWVFKEYSEPGLAVMEDDISTLFPPDHDLRTAQEIFYAKDSAYMAAFAGPATLAHELLHIFAQASHPDQFSDNGPAPIGNLLLGHPERISIKKERGFSVTYWQLKRCLAFVDDQLQHPNRQGWTP